MDSLESPEQSDLPSSFYDPKQLDFGDVGRKRFQTDSAYVSTNSGLSVYTFPRYSTHDSRTQRIRASSLSLPPLGPALLASVWTAAEGTREGTDSISRGLELDILPFPLPPARVSREHRPRSITVSFPTGEDGSEVGFQRTISSMAVMNGYSASGGESWEAMTEKFQATANAVAVLKESSTVISSPSESIQDTNSSPSRSLWIGNIDPTLSSNDVLLMFSPFGTIESIRMLPEKECCFVNYKFLEEALDARENMQGSRIGSCVVRIGFGKTDSILDTQGSQPTKSLWVGNILPHIKPAELESLFSQFGKVESARVLTHKNCGFVNFVSLDDAIRARNDWNGQEVGGSVVKIGFAKVPARDEGPVTIAQALSNPAVVSKLAVAAIERMSPWQNVLISPYVPSASPVNVTNSGTPINADTSSMTDNFHCLSIPETFSRFKHDQSRLREIRKRLEGNVTAREIELIFEEVIDTADELCSVQKIMEKTSDSNRLILIEKISPVMASLGIHKNGTWAIQKIIDLAKNPAQVGAVVAALRPYASALLLDQFGNYVIQCCLRLGSHSNQFVFDSIAEKIWDIGQGRFGARASKACLESQYANQNQQKQVSLAVVQNCVQLAMNANGSILVTWLMDSSSLPGRYRVIAPVMLPQLVILACHKLASQSLIKLVAQRTELDARDLIIKGVFENEAMLIQILSDAVNGIPFITKILSTCCISETERTQLAAFIRNALPSIRTKSDSGGNYKRLNEELESITYSAQSIVTGKQERKASLSVPSLGFYSNLSSPARPSTSQAAEEPLQHMYGIYPTPLTSPFHSQQHERNLYGNYHH